MLVINCLIWLSEMMTNFVPSTLPIQNCANKKQVDTFLEMIFASLCGTRATTISIGLELCFTVHTTSACLDTLKACLSKLRISCLDGSCWKQIQRKRGKAWKTSWLHARSVLKKPHSNIYLAPKEFDEAPSSFQQSPSRRTCICQSFAFIWLKLQPNCRATYAKRDTIESWLPFSSIIKVLAYCVANQTYLWASELVYRMLCSVVPKHHMMMLHRSGTNANSVSMHRMFCLRTCGSHWIGRYQFRVACRHYGWTLQPFLLEDSTWCAVFSFAFVILYMNIRD